MDAGSKQYLSQCVQDQTADGVNDMRSCNSGDPLFLQKLRPPRDDGYTTLIGNDYLSWNRSIKIASDAMLNMVLEMLWQM